MYTRISTQSSPNQNPHPHPMSCRRRASEACWNSPDMAATSLPACEKSRCRRGCATSGRMDSGHRGRSICRFWGTRQIRNTLILNTVVSFRTATCPLGISYKPIQTAPRLCGSAEFMAGNGKDLDSDKSAEHDTLSPPQKDRTW